MRDRVNEWLVGAEISRCTGHEGHICLVDELYEATGRKHRGKGGNGTWTDQRIHVLQRLDLF